MRIAILLLSVLAASPGTGRADGGIFEDRSADWGLDFVHFNGMTGEFYFPEMTGQGGGVLDYDNDGDLDLYLVQGAMLGPGETLADASVPLLGSPPPRDRLLRNDSVPVEHGWEPRFVDVTDRAGLDAVGYGMGLAVGDVDNDGWTDLYVTAYGPNRLFLNNGDGTYRDATEGSGAEDVRWSTSAALFDYDGDGWLDLYVANYVDYDVVENPRCYAPSSRRDYCGPADFPPQRDTLLHNRGGVFEDVTLRALQGYEAGPGLGVAVEDFDGDGRLDVFVANDGTLNHLWLNQGDGTFLDEALLAGVALNRQGRAEASMGVDVGDVDGDGTPDLFVTHLMGETDTLYLNDGRGLFTDRTIEAGLASISLPRTAFGTALFDADNDGRVDLLVLNGAVRILEHLASAGDPYPLHQSNQFFRNLGDGTFEDVTRRAGSVFELSEVSRGAAVGDVDNDGDEDVLVHNNNGPARLLVNTVGQRRDWIGIRTGVGAAGGWTLGTTVEIGTTSGVGARGRAHTDGSYCSARDPRILLGLGEAPPVRARVEFPSGRRVEWVAPPARRYLVLPDRSGDSR